MRPARVARAAWALAAGVLLAACPESEFLARRTLEQYLEAVQSGDRGSLARFSAEYAELVRGLEGPAAQAGFEEFARRTDARLAAYEEAKRGGSLDLGAEGVGLIKGLGLGRGAFYRILRVHEEGGHLRMRLEVNLGYDVVPFERFPPGTRVYLMGMPLGRMLSPVRGEAAAAPLEVLSHLELECRLERAVAPEHPTGWAVRALEAVPGSERAQSLAWR